MPARALYSGARDARRMAAAAGDGGRGRACGRCGRPIGPGRRANARYCGEQCRLRGAGSGGSGGRGRGRAGSRKCRYCGSPIGADRPARTIYCGQWCGSRANGPPGRHSSPGVPYAKASKRERERRSMEKERHESPACRYCGVPVPAGGRAGSIYCGRECRGRAERERYKVWGSSDDYRDAGEAERRRRRAPEAKRPTTCQYCGGPLPKNRTPRTRLCSDACRKRTAIEGRLHPEVRTQFEDAGEAERRRRAAARQPRTCDHCGGVIAGLTRKRYCSDKCARDGAREEYRRDPAAVALNRARQREYARRRYATAGGRASYLAASKRYHDRLKAAAKGTEAPPESAIRPRGGGGGWIWVPADSQPARGRRRRASSSRGDDRRLPRLLTDED